MSKLYGIKMAVIGKVGRGMLHTKKHSPTILMVSGVVGIVGGTVLACKATLKAGDVIATHNEKMAKIKKATEIAKDGSYTEQDRKKDVAVTYVQTGVDFIKLYGPAVTLSLASIGCMLGAHGILKRRNLALMAAYKTIEQSFSEYRKRVIDELGVESDRHFKYGTSIIEKTTMAYTDEDGVEHPEKTEAIEVIDTNGISDYAKYFNHNNKNWDPSAEYNLTWIKCQQNTANDILHSRGHIFLNEVYEMLGFDHTKAGAVVGWVKGHGEDFVDFGIFDKIGGYRNDFVGDTIAEEREDFVNGWKDSILLDFNVAGVIYDLI